MEHPEAVEPVVEGPLADLVERRPLRTSVPESHSGRRPSTCSRPMRVSLRRLSKPSRQSPPAASTGSIPATPEATTAAPAPRRRSDRRVIGSGAKAAILCSDLYQPSNGPGQNLGGVCTASTRGLAFDDVLPGRGRRLLRRGVRGHGRSAGGLPGRAPAPDGADLGELTIAVAGDVEKLGWASARAPPPSPSTWTRCRACSPARSGPDRERPQAARTGARRVHRRRYRDRAIVTAGVGPRRAVETSQYFEPWMIGVDVPAWSYTAVAGMDLVRGADGLLCGPRGQPPHAVRHHLRVRRARTPWTPRFRAAAAARRSLAPAYEALRAALREAAPKATASPSWSFCRTARPTAPGYEHRGLAQPPRHAARYARRPLPEPRRAEGDGRRPEPRGGRGLPPHRRGPPPGRPRAARPGRPRCCSTRAALGRLACVNAFGSGVADDKLVHAYVRR